MRALVVYCHPSPSSFTAAVRDVVLARLAARGAEVRVTDLYARGFEPVLTRAEWEGYATCPDNIAPVAGDVADLRWCDTLIFVYPTWWFGMPALLKGWLDRVFLPDVAFLMPTPQNRATGPALLNIARLGVFTTCGASWWLTTFIGAPGRRTLMTGVGGIISRHARKTFAAIYRMDTQTPQVRARHLANVARKMDRLLAGGRPEVRA